MATSLVPLSISAPGFFGLNTQEAAVDLPINWSLDATNCIIDQYGRIASRKGWTQTTTTAISGTPTIKVIHEYISVIGVSTILSCAGNKIYSGTTTLTDLSAPGTITADNWKIVNFNGKAYFFQSDHVPLEYDGTDIGYITRGFTAWTASTAVTVDTIRRPTTANPYYYVCVTAGTTTASEPTWDTTVGGTTSDGTAVWMTYEVEKADAAVGALGRLWIANTTTDKTVVYYSDTLIGHDFYSGASGSIDLKTVWTNGMDQIVSLETFNGMFVIFAKNSTILYSGGYDPASMQLVEVIRGIGCNARDSVQDLGDDILFFNNSGVNSLTRAVNNDNIGTASISSNVRDFILSMATTSADIASIKSTYNKKEGFYLINFPSSHYVFCFDIRGKLEDGSYKITTWDSINPWALYTTRENVTYLGKDGVIGTYEGFYDNGASYLLQYRSTWQHLDNQNQLKMPKSVEISVIGGFNAVMAFKISYDYSILETVFSKTIPAGTTAEYGIAEYGIAEYSSSSYINKTKYQITGNGKTFSFAISSAINGSSLSIQKIDLLTKLGRIL